MIFVDSNYFLRYLLNDISAQHRAVVDLFKQAASGKVALFTSSLVIFEIYWVLKSCFAMKSSEYLPLLDELVRLSIIQIEEKEVLLSAIELAGCENMELEDCFNIRFAQEKAMTEFRTYDKKINRFVSSQWNPRTSNLRIKYADGKTTQ